MLTYKPHSVTVTVPQGSPLPGGGAGTPDQVGEATVACQVTPVSADAVYDKFGVEVARPHLLMANATDEPYFALNGTVMMGSREFRVSAPNKLWNAIPAISFVEVLLDEVTHA